MVVNIYQKRVLERGHNIPLINSRNIIQSIRAIRCFDVFCNQFVDVGIAVHVDQVDAKGRWVGSIQVSD